MAPTYYLITLGVLFGTPIVIFGMKYFSAAQQARARALADDGYRDMAQKTAASLTALQGDLSEIKTRLAAVEKILKAVE